MRFDGISQASGIFVPLAFFIAFFVGICICQKKVLTLQKNLQNMEIKEKLSALRGIVNKTASALTVEDKDLIATLAKEHGVTLRSKRCGSCYIDAAVEIFGKLSKEVEPAPEQTDSEHKYVLKDGVDILHNGVRINQATITDELAERMVAKGLSLTFFAKYPEV